MLCDTYTHKGKGVPTIFGPLLRVNGCPILCSKYIYWKDRYGKKGDRELHLSGGSEASLLRFGTLAQQTDCVY